jgi:hypothetical protein
MPWGFAAAAVAAAGTIYAGMQANQQAKTQANILNQQADRERQQAAENEAEFRDQQARAEATRRAILGGSGVRLDTGSPLLASEDFAGDVELQALKIRNGGDVTATRLQQSAALTRAQGSALQTGSYFRAGSLLIAGGGKSGFFDKSPTSTANISWNQYVDPASVRD